jgi:hypothetical protein
VAVKPTHVQHIALGLPSASGRSKRSQRSTHSDNGPMDRSNAPCILPADSVRILRIHVLLLAALAPHACHQRLLGVSWLLRRVLGALCVPAGVRPLRCC